MYNEVGVVGAVDCRVYNEAGVVGWSGLYSVQ